MSDVAVGIRLGLTGDAEVKTGLASIGDAGDKNTQRLVSGFERASAAADAAAARAQAAGQKVAAALAAGNTANSQPVAFSGNQNAQVQAYVAYQATMARQAEALRNAIDPLRVAQAAYDDEVRTANSLLAQGAIKEAERDAAVALAGKTLQQAKNALDEHTASLGLNRAQTQIAQSAIMRFTDSLIAGQSPIRAFALEAHKIGEVAAFDNGGVAGALEKVSSILTPTAVGITATTVALIAGAVAWLQYDDAVQKFGAMANTFGALAGATKDQLEQIAESAASASGVTVSAARDFETSYLQTGKIGAQVLPGLIALTQDFAAATGQDAKEATKELATAFADPAKGAEDLMGKIGALDAGTLAYIQTLVQNGNETQAQLMLLNSLQGATAKAATNINGMAWAWRQVTTAASEASTWLGRAIDQAMGGSAAQQLASLQSQRARAVSDSYGLADASGYDRQIASLQQQLGAAQQRQNQARARSDAAPGLKIVDSFTGDDQLAKLKTDLTSVNKLLADNGNAAGLTAQQIAGARAAQDAYTHAVETYLSPAAKQQQLDQLDAQIAAAKTPQQKAALAAQKDRVEQSGKVITSAQAEADAHAKGAAALAAASKAGASHTATLGREAASMEVAARQSLLLADAYLQGGAAAIVAEARRKALTDATKKGIDTEAEVRRQLALTIDEGVASGAKAAGALTDENLARAAVIAAVQNGTLAAGAMSDALSDEAALRQDKILLGLATEQAQRDALTRVINAETAALATQHRLQQDMAALNAIRSANDSAAASADTAEFAGDRSGAGTIEIARRAAQRQAINQYPNADQSVVSSFVDAQVRASKAAQEATRAKTVADMVNDQTDQNALLRVQLSLVGSSADTQERVTAQVQLQQQLAKSLGSDYDAQAPALLKAADAIVVAQQHLKLLQSDWNEIKQTGDEIVEDLFNPQNWTSWGALGKKVLQDLESEFLKLAAINPLKNALFGENNSTLGSVIGNIGKLFGGGDPFASSEASVDTSLSNFKLSGVPGFATGTDSAPGGLAWVAENGPELVNLPRGASVTPAAQTRQILSAANASGPVGRVVVSVETNDDVFNARVAGISGTQIQAAAPQIAQGGAVVARVNADRVRRRTMR